MTKHHSPASASAKRSQARRTRSGPIRSKAKQHDHRRCVAEALSEAENLATQRGLSLTPIRRRVLELVWASHQPVGAYELLAELGRETGRVQPPTVYRALDFLLRQGLIHRIESRNAFIGCACPRESHAGQFLICRNCREATELTQKQMLRPLVREAVAHGFQVERYTVELEGLCRRCQEEET